MDAPHGREVTPSELAHDDVAVLWPVDVAHADRVVTPRLVVAQLLLLVGEDALERDARRRRRVSARREGPRLAVRPWVSAVLVPDCEWDRDGRCLAASEACPEWEERVSTGT